MKWPRSVLPWLGIVFFGVVIYLLADNLSDLDWGEVLDSLRGLSFTTLFFALVGVFLNYAILSSYDFLGLRYLGVNFLSWPKVFWAAFVSYVFNLNFGALVGGVGLRFRIYSRWNVPLAKIPMLFAFCILTNWIGHMALLSMLFIFRGPQVEELIHLKAPLVQFLGGAALLLVVFYLYLCFKRAEYHRFKFPPLPLAFLQLLLASLQWGILSGILVLILNGLKAPVPYGDILFTYLMASVAGVIAHIPGGLGVLETVFLEMGLPAPKARLVVALICFRSLYYIVPLLIGIPGYLGLEIYQKKTDWQSRDKKL